MNHNTLIAGDPKDEKLFSALETVRTEMHKQLERGVRYLRGTDYEVDMTLTDGCLVFLYRERINS